MHAYLSELSQVPVAASSKTDAIARLTEVNQKEATGGEEIRLWTPYNRRSLPIRNSFTGSKRIRKENPVNAARFPLSSEAVDNTDNREIIGQESRKWCRGLLVDSMAMALLQEVNHILEQERHAHTSENSVRVASKATSTGHKMKQLNPDYGRSFPIRNDAIYSEAIGKVNYCCCEWWL
jgi:hypothetical protein